MPTPEQVLQALDEEQRAAVLAPQGPLCIVAGAGTGKTRTITHRIAYHDLTQQMPASAVLAVTHSTKSASEMRERLAALGVRAQARTFHAAALRQLRYHWARLDRASDGPQLLVDPARAQMIRAVTAKVIGMDAPRVAPDLVRDLGQELSWAARTLVSPQEYPSAAAAAKRGVDIPAEQAAEVLRRYTEAKHRESLLDFDDLLGTCAHLIENDPAVAASVRGQYRSFLVDEYQDTDPLQERLLRAWVGDGRQLCVVGDAGQSIYGFKGADPGLLAGFAHRFPTAVTVALVRDYRSTPQVVAVANAVSAPGTVALVGQRDAGPVPEVRSFAHDDDETAGVVTWVRGRMQAGVEPEEIAVLHRFRAQSLALQVALTGAGVAVAVAKGDAFFDLPIVQRVLSALRAAARLNPDRPGRPAFAEALAATGWSRDAEPVVLGGTRERWESLVALEDLVAGFAARTLGDLLAELERLVTAEHVPSGGRGVTVTTLHQAKGLEWDAVCLPRLTDGSLPASLGRTDAGRAEERRLFYVGVTRARVHLHLTWAKTWGDRRAPSKVSPFLALVGSCTVDRDQVDRGGPSLTLTTTKSSTPVAKQRFEVGVRVLHTSWGLGTVLSCGGTTCKVDFGSLGVRDLKASSSTLSRL